MLVPVVVTAIGAVVGLIYLAYLFIIENPLIHSGILFFVVWAVLSLSFWLIRAHGGVPK
jgi:hypothetical protein